MMWKRARHNKSPADRQPFDYVKLVNQPAIKINLLFFLFLVHNYFHLFVENLLFSNYNYLNSFQFNNYYDIIFLMTIMTFLQSQQSLIRHVTDPNLNDIADVAKLQI